MAIESKNLLVWVKAMSRGQALPLDASETYDSLAEANNYAANSAIAYGGQTIKAKLEDGKYHSYVLQPSESGYTLEEVGAIKSSDLKQYVMVVENLPESGQAEGVLYIHGTDGYVWTGSDWRKVFHDVSSDVYDLTARVDSAESELANKAPIANPEFTGVVKVGGEEIALKSYVDGLFANLTSAEPGIVSSTSPLPAEYKAGQHFRVAEEGTYAGVECEIGDLILVVKTYNAETASNDDFMVLQANIDGAVTSGAETSTVGEVVVFDSVTGKVIKGSGIQIDSLNDVISKAHEHANKDALDTYDKTQEALLAEAKSEAEALVNAHKESVNIALSDKADKGTTLAEYGIDDAYDKAATDALLNTIRENLNTKISATDVDTKIEEAREEILTAAAADASEKLEARIGSIPADTNIKTYIDNAVGSGGSASADAIAAAKQEAIDTSKSYTDTKIVEALTVVEF